jgi:hypothetical protein
MTRRRKRINCPEGLGNRVATIANALTWHSCIEFGWEVNEHCPLAHEEVFPFGIGSVDFVPGDGSPAGLMDGRRPPMDWDAARCRVHAGFTYARVISAIGAKAAPDAPDVAIVARFHRAQPFDLARLAIAAGRVARRLGASRVFLLSDRHRDDIELMINRHTQLVTVRASAPELEADLARTTEATRDFLQDWRTALAARHIVALDGPTSLLHPARAAGIPITYA